MNMKRLLSLVAFFATLHASAQQVNPVPDYVFRNQMSVGRGTVTDTAAYFSIGPRYGANKGFMPPIVGDTATFSSGKRNGLLIFSVQKNKFLYWDSVRVQWSDMAGSSGTYITGTGITGYVPQFSGTTTIDTSALFTLGSRLGIGTSTFAYTSTNTGNVELNGTAGGILGFKRNDTARGYLWHTGDNMELANTTAGAISFNTNSATRGSISSAGVWRLHNLAGTGDRVVVASSNGTLSASTSVTGLVDTTTISTRAWRQKGDDSLGAIIATKGSGTVTSVATGYGLSGGTITTTGTLLVDTLNIATRAWRQKGLDSLAALEVSGSGTTNYVPKFTAASSIGNSQIFDNGTSVGIGTASPTVKLDVSQATTGSVVRFQGDAALLRYLEFKSIDVGAFTGAAWDRNVNSASGYHSWSTAGTERLRITSGGNVGIGTDSPNDRLTIQSGTSVASAITFRANNVTSTSELFLGQAAGNEAYVYNRANQPMVFGTNNAERLRIFANGRIGVNTTTDAGYQLDVNGSIRAIGLIRSQSTVGNINGYFQLDHPGSQTWKLGVFADNASTFSIGNDNGGVFASRYLNITNVGDIGIATTSPSYKLDINGTLRSVNGANFATTSGNVGIGTTSATDSYSFGKALDMHGSNGAALYMRYATDPTVQFGMIGYDRTGLGLYLSTNNALPIVFYTSNTQRGRINSAGEWIIDASGTDAGDYKLQVAGNIYASGLAKINDLIINGNSPFVTGANVYTNGQSLAIGTQGANLMSFFTNNTERGRINSAGEWIIDASGTDAGDYKLQVVGNARIGTGKLDISSNTAFSMNVQRSGTSEVAGTFNNSNGILYLGAESSTGGSLFTGSSAYAAVIGSGAAYPLQFATNNVVRATINADGEMLIGGTDVGLYNLQVTGNAYTQTFQYVGNVLGINTGTYNSAGTAQITMKNGTNPDGSVTDQFILYSADVVAGNAAPHFRTENGGIIKLYQETTAVGAATFTANSGTAVNDASTFDGYTLKQIVKALRNQGILQ